MKRFMLQFAAMFLIVALTGSVAIAGGYQLNEHGARATALGGAFVARSTDASAIYFNPAGLAFQKGMHFLVGASFILPSTTVLNKTGVPTETKMESQLFYPPNIYGTYEISDGLVAGIGVFTPFGLGSKYASDWVGRQLSVETDLKTFFITPTISYKLMDNLSVGVGFSYIIGSVTLGRKVPTRATLTAMTLPSGTAYIPGAVSEGEIALDGSATNFCFSAGFIFKPFEGLSLGGSFRSEAKMEFEGDAVFTNMQGLQPWFPGGTGKATLPMPMNIQVGAAYDVTKDLNVEVDFQYVGWSAYDKLTLDIPVGPPVSLIVAAGPPPVVVTQILQGPSSEDKLWEDGMLFRAGVEYLFDDQLTLRVGGLLDYTPQPTGKMEPMLPDANRVDLSVGAGYKVSSNMTVDLVYMAVLFDERNSTYTKFPASYNSMAHIIGFNFGYSF